MQLSTNNPELILNKYNNNQMKRDTITETPFMNNKDEEVHHFEKIKIPVLSSPEELKNSNDFLTITSIISSPKDKPKWRKYLGLFLTILSSIMFSINALIFKILKSYHPFTVGTYMFIVTGLLAIPFYLYETFTTKENPRNDKFEKKSLSKRVSLADISPKQIFILLARAFTGCSGMLFFFYSLQYMTMGDALVIACSSPVFVFLLAFLFLKESCGIVPILTIILALIGVTIITRPPLLTGKAFETEDLIGAALAFGSMLSIASTLILMRFLQDVHHSLINLIFGIWGSAQTFFLALAVGVLKFPENISDGSLMTMTGLFFFIGQTFLAFALQLEEAGPVSLLRTSEVIFAFILQFLFLNVYPDVYSVSGAVLIMVGILTTILRKWVGSMPSSNVTRRKLNFILK